MRISLLLEREPFGLIFEKTVAGFLESQAKIAYEVHWISKQDPRYKPHISSEGLWYCNPYINAIFSNKAKSDVFEPVVREFSRSTQWWKRPIQLAYVKAAVWPATRVHLASAMITISPVVAAAEQYLFLGGNQKIRLLDCVNKRSYGLQKYGFPALSIQREIEVRQMTAKLGLSVPQLQTFAANQAWFSEDYIVGTPVNRLVKPDQQLKASQAAFQELGRLWKSTEEEVNTLEYTTQLIDRIYVSINAIPLLSNDMRVSLESSLKSLQQQIERLAVNHETIASSFSHGDFQAANILVKDADIWLIDWEYADRRFLGYDVLVFGLGSRMPVGLATRLGGWLKHGELLAEIQNLPVFTNRKLIASLFLLEELGIHLNENANPLFTRLSQGLVFIQTEIQAWLKDMGQ